MSMIDNIIPVSIALDFCFLRLLQLRNLAQVRLYFVCFSFDKTGLVKKYFSAQKSWTSSQNQILRNMYMHFEIFKSQIKSVFTAKILKKSLRLISKLYLEILKLSAIWQMFIQFVRLFTKSRSIRSSSLAWDNSFPSGWCSGSYCNVSMHLVKQSSAVWKQEQKIYNIFKIS